MNDLAIRARRPRGAASSTREVARCTGRTLYRVHELGKRSFMEPLWNIGRVQNIEAPYFEYEVREQGEWVGDRICYLADVNIGTKANENYLFSDSITAMDYLRYCLERG